MLLGIEVDFSIGVKALKGYDTDTKSFKNKVFNDSSF